jgi:hypothetical protein
MTLELPVDANDERVRNALDLAVGMGALSLVCVAFSVADWADWLIEIGEDPHAAVSADILGRQLEMLALGGITVAVAMAALVLRGRDRATQELARWLGVVGALLVGALVGLHWNRGFYFHLEHTGPLVGLGLAVIQSLVLARLGGGNRREPAA